MIKGISKLVLTLRPIVLMVFIASFIPLSNIEAQDAQQTWISKYMLNIQREDMVSGFTDNDFRNRSLKEIEIDSLYSEASVIVQFLPQNKFILKPLFHEKRTGTYIQKQDTIFAKTDSVNWCFSIKNEELVLLDLDSSWQSTHIWFERLSPTELNKNLKIKDIIKEETYWRLSIDSSSRYFASTLYFYSNDSVIIERRFSDFHGSTGTGRYYFDFFEGHTFIGYYDRQRLDFFNMHLIAKSGNTLIGQTSEVYEYPFLYKRNDLILEQISKPDKTELSAIRKLLVGTWESTEEVFPSDTLLTRYDSIIDQYYELTFLEDGEFSLNYGGIVVNGENVNPEIKTYTGNWSLGATGKFIKLEHDDGRTFFLSILSLDDNSISYSLDFDTLGEEGAYFGNYFINLSKR